MNSKNIDACNQAISTAEQQIQQAVTELLGKLDELAPVADGRHCVHHIEVRHDGTVTVATAVAAACDEAEWDALSA